MTLFPFLPYFWGDYRRDSYIEQFLQIEDVTETNISSVQASNLVRDAWIMACLNFGVSDLCTNLLLQKVQKRLASSDWVYNQFLWSSSPFPLISGKLHIGSKRLFEGTMELNAMRHVDAKALQPRELQVMSRKQDPGVAGRYQVALPSSRSKELVSSPQEIWLLIHGNGGGGGEIAVSPWEYI